jgi:hypothetical protein
MIVPVPNIGLFKYVSSYALAMSVTSCYMFLILSYCEDISCIVPQRSVASVLCTYRHVGIISAHAYSLYLKHFTFWLLRSDYISRTFKLGPSKH